MYEITAQSPPLWGRRHGEAVTEGLNRRHENVNPNLVVKVSSSLCKTPQSPAVPAPLKGRLSTAVGNIKPQDYARTAESLINKFFTCKYRGVVLNFWGGDTHGKTQPLFCNVFKNEIYKPLGFDAKHSSGEYQRAQP